MSRAPRAAPARWPLGVAAAALAVAAWQWARSSAGPEPASRPPASGAEQAGVERGSAAGDGPACGPQQLPDDGVCLPVPPLESEAAAAASTPIELLPGRPPDYARYVTPIATYPAQAAPGELGLFVAAPRGAPVTAVSLESQSGPTRRWVTATTPRRLLTLHRVERSGAERTYVLAYDGVAFDSAPGLQEVAVGTPLGRVAPGPGVTGLTLRVRQLRRGIDPESLAPERLLLDASSLACDPRNVLPLEPGP